MTRHSRKHCDCKKSDCKKECCEEIGIILVPTQDGSNVGVPHMDVYNAAAKVWPVKKIHYRLTSLPLVAGGTKTSPQVADEVEGFVNSLKAQGVKKFIMPASNSIMVAWLSGIMADFTTGAPKTIPPYNVRHTDIVCCTQSAARRTAANYGGNGNLFVFSDYLSDFDSTFSGKTLVSAVPNGSTVMFLFQDYLNRTDGNGQLARSVSQDLFNLFLNPSLVGSTNTYTVLVYGIHFTGTPTAGPYDYSNAYQYSPTDANFVLNPTPLATGINLGNEITSKNPYALFGQAEFATSGPTSWLGSALAYDTANPSNKIFRSGLRQFLWEADSLFTVPVDVAYGGGLGETVFDLLNCESVSTGWPTTNCDWDNYQGFAALGLDGNGDHGYTLVEMFAYLATCFKYCGPQNKQKFRSNGVQISPYLVAGLGQILPANTRTGKSDKIIRNPKWENDTVNLIDVVDPQGPVNQSFGFC